MMDFDEPDLEELIQHDLHSEMNKILDESNSDSQNSQKIAMATNTMLPHSPNNERQSPLPLCKNGKMSPPQSIGATQHTESNGISNIKITNVCSSHREVTDAFSCLGPIPLTAVKSEMLATDFSGHFSVEQFPTSGVEDHIAMDLIQKSEPNDLSNLAWLTTVDVQQALQRDTGLILDSEGDNIVSSGQEQISLSSDMPFPTTLTGGPNPNFSPQTAGNAPVSVGGVESTHVGYRTQPRYTPIQPHPNHDQTHQRYLLHGGHQSNLHHRTLLPMSDRPGPHRFTHHGGHNSGYHPYPPPPPYGAAGFNHDGYHYNRPQNINQKIYPKPVYSYSCLIAMSLQKSKTGCLPVSDIYSFMMENFPYFKTAPDGWKNSVRHNLSLNKCFEKVEKPNGTQRKGCLWALNPAKAGKMEEEVQKWKRKDPEAIRRSMSHPDEFDREMEELRRADEETARRRMLSLSSHGLSMATPHSHGFHPGYQIHRDPGHVRPHMHPSGSVSMPTTPQHLSPQAGAYRHPMTPSVHRAMSTNAKAYGHAGNHASAHPRQLFQFPAEPQVMPLGAPEVSSTPVAKATSSFTGPGTPLKALPQLSSPNSSSSTSSGTCAFFGSIADSLSAAGGPDLNDLDLDSSLADLSALQGPFWDDATGTDTPHDGASDPVLSGDVYDESDAHRSGTQTSGDSMTPTFHVMRQSAHSSGENVNGDVFPSRFGGDLSYLASTGNNKPVMLH